MPITYFDTDWSAIGLDVGNGQNVYQDVTLTGCQTGDIIVVFGIVENYGRDAFPRSISDETVGGVKTGSWSYAEVALDFNDDVDFYAGHCAVTSSGSITLRVVLRDNGPAQRMGAGAYLIPSSMINGSYGFIDSGFKSDVDGLRSVTLSAQSLVLYMGGDWTTQDPGTTLAPSGGTVFRSTTTPSYAMFTAAWEDQAAGTRNYGPGGLSSRKIGGVIFALASTVGSPPTTKWYSSTGAPLTPHVLTGSGIVQLE